MAYDAKVRLSRRRFLVASTGILSAACTDPVTLAWRLLRGYPGRTDPLAPFAAALAAATSSPVDILCIGDSLTLGQAASSTAARWPDLLGAALAATYDPTHAAAIHYPPVWDAARPFANPWVNTGSPTTNVHFGPGRIAGNLTTGKTMSYTFSGTGFDLYYAQGPAGSGFGEFSYAVDGGAPTTVDARDATMLGSRRVRVTGLSAGTHTIALAPVSASVPIEGVIGYDGTEASGIRIWNGGHGGYTSANFNDAAEPHWVDILDTVTPDLVTIMLGVNDCYLTTVSAVDFRTNLEAIIANVRAGTSGDPTFLLVAAYQALNRTTWSDYVNAMSALVAADTHGRVVLLSLVPDFGGYVDVSAGTYIDSDRIHPTTAGHAFIESLIKAGLGV